MVNITLSVHQKSQTRGLRIPPRLSFLSAWIFPSVVFDERFRRLELCLFWFCLDLLR